MDNRFILTSQALARRFRKHAFSTTTRRWTFGGIIAGLLAASFIPAMGLAVAGGAVAIWGWVVAGVIGLGGLSGNAVGSHRAKRALQKEKANRAA